MKVLQGNEIKDYVDELGRFRMEIFKEFPYLYEGSLEYERKYLSRYAGSSESVLILMKDARGLMGACTGIPLHDEDTDFVRPFQEVDIEEIFYIGEVMVRADSRGKGLGTNLLSKMLDLITGSRFKIVCFYTVDRGTSHPLRPHNYKSPVRLWKKFGFVKDPEKLVYFRWKDLGNSIETDKPMNVWIKKL
jgi:GNAT superfamily N-acetyltransferase